MKENIIKKKRTDLKKKKDNNVTRNEKWLKKNEKENIEKME